jgi:serine/arginine repetitive matrix protein 1
LSAQDSPQGVPKELLEAKKLELMQEKVSLLSVIFETLTDAF